MKIVNDDAPAEIEEIIVRSLVPCLSSIPLPVMPDWMLNRDPLAQFVTAFWTYRNRA